MSTSAAIANTGKVDPITRQVIANRLESIPQEMAQIIMRTARSPIIVGGKDFSCGLLDAEAQLLATPEGSPVHIFPVVAEVRFIQEKFGDDIHSGDVFFANDFSEGGTHLNDVLLCSPFFFEDELVAFVATRGHLTDVGGMSPGSITGKAREIYQEGFRIPTVKLYERGELVRALWETFLFNVRVPEQNDGDLQALLVGCRLGLKRNDRDVRALRQVHDADRLRGNPRRRRSEHAGDHPQVTRRDLYVRRLRGQRWGDGGTPHDPRYRHRGR